MSLEGRELSELKDRYFYLIEKYVELSKELVKKFEKFGKYREELQLISSEFAKRHHSVEDPKNLEEEILGIIRERSSTEQVNEAPNTTQGHTVPRTDSIEST